MEAGPTYLSIGIPSYNHAEFIEETLTSLLNQTVAPLEIVVSDDHSTDRTPEILKKYRDRVRVIRPPKHLSMTGNWNYVTSHLSGSWFSLVCSDDIPLPNFVETLTRGTTVSDNAVLVRAAS